MASLEQRGPWFRVIFRFNGQRFAHALDTEDRKVAEGFKGGIERTLMLLHQNVLRVPDGVDPLSFILTGGHAAEPIKKAKAVSPPEKETEPLTLRRLHDRYLPSLNLSLEANSLATVKMHLGHVMRHFGATCLVADMTPARLQEYVETRASKKGHHKRPLSPATIKKEITSLRAAWNWAMEMQLHGTPFPAVRLKFPKSQEKPPFQTWAEIERKIHCGVADSEAKELWDALFLTLEEIQALLQCVRDHSQQPFIYPMFCFAAHTGARRSEIMRSRLSDLDLATGIILIHEKKRVRGTSTSRTVPLSPFLAGVLRDWLQHHPGGPFLFCQPVHVFRSKKKRNESTPVTRNEANDHFKRTLAESKWKVLRGWHVFRHSFASNCAAKGVDQRLIDAWLGHQTEEMRRRYRHCFPSQHRQAIQLVFG